MFFNCSNIKQAPSKTLRKTFLIIYTNLELTLKSQYAPKNKDVPQRKAVCTLKFITGDLLPIVLQESGKINWVPSTVCIFLWVLDRKSKHIHYFLPNISQCLREAKYRKTKEDQFYNMAHLWYSGFTNNHFKQKSLIWYGQLPLYLIYTIQTMCRGVKFSLVRVTLYDLGMALPHSEVKSRQWDHPAELFFSGSPMTRITKAKENEDCPDCRMGLAESSNNSSLSHQGVVTFRRLRGTIDPTSWNRGSLSTNLLIAFVDYGIVAGTWVWNNSSFEKLDLHIPTELNVALECWDLKTSESPSPTA